MRGFFAGSRVALVRRLGVSAGAVTVAGANVNDNYRGHFGTRENNVVRVVC